MSASAANRRKLGVGGTLSYAAARAAALVPGAAFHRYRIIALDTETMPAMPRGYEVAVGEAPESFAGHIDAQMQTIRYRLAQAMVPLTVSKAGRLVGVIWLSAGAFDEDEVRVRWKPPAGMGWDTGLWIAPDARLTRAFPALWAGAAEWLRSHGLRGTASRIADYNLASLAPHERLGARTLGHVSVASLGRRQLSSSGSPRLTVTKRTLVDTGRLR